MKLQVFYFSIGEAGIKKVFIIQEIPITVSHLKALIYENGFSYATVLEFINNSPGGVNYPDEYYMFVQLIEQPSGVDTFCTFLNVPEY